jgi:hypothetical protein
MFEVALFFAVLILLCVILRVAGLRYYRHINASAPPVAPSFEGITDEELAVLTAAVTVAVQRPIRLRRIRFIERRGGSTWAAMGRVNIMASHLVNRNKG